MNYEPVIGLEVHAQLKTKSKVFCGCSTEFGASPNDHVCPVCLGMPGVLPVLNKGVVANAIKAGLALNCKISEVTKFDRKNYFYPDLPKGYQISQFDQPICKTGHLDLLGKRIRIHRAHVEEDAGKLVHAGAEGLHGSDYSLVDFNRSGVPLLEIVSEPDITSPEEARQYLTELRNILRYIDVCDGNLEEGSFRCDANVSVRPVGHDVLGTRTEIKNMNSFKAVQMAIESEIERQIEMLENGEKVVQETRLWNERSKSTFPMRSKEEAHDYRYFPEPDLVPLQIDKSWIESLRGELPELPDARRKRYTETLGLPLDDAVVLAESKELSDLLDESIKIVDAPKVIANWLIGPTTAYLKESGKEVADLKLTAQNLADLATLVGNSTIGSTVAKQLLADLLVSPGDVISIVKEKNLAQISDEAGLRTTINEVLGKFPDQVREYRGGKTKVRQFFVGELMKITKGKANPQVLNKLLDELLAGEAA